MSISPIKVGQYAWIAWLISWVAAAKWSAATERRPTASLESAYRLLTAVGAILLVGSHPRWRPAEITLWRADGGAGWALLAVMFCGFAFAWWARLTLGRLWSSGVARKTDHRIVTEGPYRLARHPIYTGIILAVLATAAMRGTVGAYAGAITVALGLFVKARIEERFLRGELGDAQYEAYARRVAMLVPFLF